MRHSVKWIKLLPSQCGWRCLMRRFSSPSSSELPFSENKWQTIHEGVWLARSSFAAFPVRSRGKFFTRKGQIFHPGSRVIFHSPCGWWCPPCVSNDDDNDGVGAALGWNEAKRSVANWLWIFLRNSLQLGRRLLGSKRWRAVYNGNSNDRLLAFSWGTESSHECTYRFLRDYT